MKEKGTRDEGRGTRKWIGNRQFSIFNFQSVVWPLVPYALCLMPFLLPSCDMGEIPVPPHEPGEVQTAQVAMRADYRYSIYFNLETGLNVSEHVKTTWDLGFETTADGHHIRLNGSKLMAAAITEASSLRTITSTADAVWKVDAPSGNPDSTAVGDWRDGRVRLIDRGFGISGNPLGFMKMRTEFTVDGYLVHFAAIEATDSFSIAIAKDATVNMVCLSLENAGSIIPIEPHRDNWHLLFTQYTHVFIEDGEVIPYLVTGVLTNPALVQSAMIDTSDFGAIDLAFAQTQTYSLAVDIIGYNWKEYSFETGTYTVFPNRCHLLRMADGSYFKLRFLDFYTQGGEKGAPMFEFQRL